MSAARALESAAGVSSKCMRWLWWQIRTNARNTTIKIKGSATKSLKQLSEVKPFQEMKTEAVQADIHSAFMPKCWVWKPLLTPSSVMQVSADTMDVTLGLCVCVCESEKSMDSHISHSRRNSSQHVWD